MTALPSITYVAVTGHQVNRHARALMLSQERFPVRQVLLISPEPPTIPFRGTWRPINSMDYRTYGKFQVLEMWKHIETEYCITIQADGYVLDGSNWNPEFLAYDYIGAPWPPEICMPGCRVGNSGFSLRSVRWLRAAQDCPKYRTGVGDDVFFCQHEKSHWTETHGCSIAPVDLAIQFSLELPIPEHPRWDISRSFGFHGLFNGRHHLALAD